MIIQIARKALESHAMTFPEEGSSNPETSISDTATEQSANKAIFWFSLVERGCLIWGTSWETRCHDRFF